MGGYKHIETAVGSFVAAHYTRAVEVGIGKNPGAAHILSDAGKLLFSTDIREMPIPKDIPFVIDDIFSPDSLLYRDADVIYSIRPAVEMVPPLLALADTVNCDLLVYHLGFESWGDGGERIDCGVILHRYRHRQNPSNRVD